ncbi:MAG TPA: hypothetical protein VLN56_00015 [Gammaproteobacteria bacterium]|nr:hypothetical protein [Gammaproteobacteria bacterium]
MVVPNERRVTPRYPANALSLWVARSRPALCVNRLGDSYGYPLRLAPLRQVPLVQRGLAP